MVVHSLRPRTAADFRPPTLLWRPLISALCSLLAGAGNFEARSLPGGASVANQLAGGATSGHFATLAVAFALQCCSVRKRQLKRLQGKLRRTVAASRVN